MQFPPGVIYQAVQKTSLEILEYFQESKGLYQEAEKKSIKIPATYENLKDWLSGARQMVWYKFQKR